MGDVVANIHSHAWLQAQCQAPPDTHHTPGQEGTRNKVSWWAGEGHSSSEGGIPLEASLPDKSDLALQPGQVSRDVKARQEMALVISQSFSPSWSSSYGD